MKLYSIWWEEEILLMCSCNDCSKKSGEWKREANGCLRLNSSKEIKALKVRFSIFRPWKRFLLKRLCCKLLPLTLEALNCCDAGRPRESRPFDSCGENVLPTSAMLVGGGEAPAEAVYLIQPRLARHGITASPDLVVFQQWRTDVARNQMPKFALVAAPSLYNEDVSVFNKPVSQHGQS